VTEGDLLADLLVPLREAVSSVDTGVVFKHADASSGLPDLSVTCHGKTSWWEAKLADPRIRHANELQHLTMRRLAVAGMAWYIVWDQGPGGDRHTSIVAPKLVGANGYWTAHRSADGWDSKFVVDFILRTHGLGL
jgi:hypothetical protein